MTEKGAKLKPINQYMPSVHVSLEFGINDNYHPTALKRGEGLVLLLRVRKSFGSKGLITLHYTYNSFGYSYTVQPVLSGPQKDKKMVFNTNYGLMQGKSIAECSKGSIL